jgi:hypothetical protein
LWFDYHLKYKTSSDLAIGGDVGLRGFISNLDWNQYYIRPALTFRGDYRLSFNAAIAYFRTDNKFSSNQNEFRFHQQVTLNWPDLSWIEFIVRLRIEQRLFSYTEDIPNEFINRGRFLVGVQTRNFNWFGPRFSIYFKGSVEAFRPIFKEAYEETFVNQYRINFAIGHTVNGRIRYEINYTNQESELFQKDGSVSYQNIFRIRLLHQITKDF